MPETNLAALLLEHPAADDEPLLHGPDRSWTAGEARARVAALVAELGDLEPGGAVAVHLPDGPEVVLAMAAIWAAGGVFVPVNPRLPDAEVERVLADTGPARVVDVDGVHVRPGPHAVHEPGVAFILWTSGTSGRPKPVLHTHEAYLELLDRVLGPLRASRRDPARPPSPNLIPVSMALNAGIYNSLFGLRAGAPLVLLGRFTPEAFAEAVHRHEIRSTVLPPAAMAMLLDSDVDDLGPLRYVRSITAPLSPVLARRFTDRFGATVLNGYGQAEIGEVIGWTAADAKGHPDRIGAIGRPHPGVDLRIDDPDGNGVGELLVRPPNRAIDLADERLSDDGFVHTGDLARVDEAGFVWIEGRLGDVINRGGNKVFPEHVEEALRTVEGVVDAAVVPGPDERLGEVPVAFIVGEGDVSDADLEAACRDHLAAYKVPVAFHRTDELPRNEIGKVLRRELSQRARERDA